MNESVLLTGASGFVGRHLAASLIEHDIKVVCPVRTQFTLDGAHIVPISDIDEHTKWSQCLTGATVVIHTAARVHVMKDFASDPLAEYRRVNVAGSLNLARQAATAGIKRFVFLSTVKVNGEETPIGEAFSEDDIPAPQDAYGVSKYEAEQSLLELAAKTGMEVVIIRAPLIYGPGVKANFESMLRWLYRGIPLPLGATGNKRSFVYVKNLASLIIQCIEHPKAANEVFFVSDGKDMSTTELLMNCAAALGVKPRLVSVPQGILTIAASILGKKAVVQRLCGSLQVDINKAKRLVDWAPPISVDEGLRATAKSILVI